MIRNASLLLILIVLITGTIAMLIVMSRHGAPLRAAGYKICKLELAPTEAEARKVIGAWKGLLDVAYEDIRFDYGFIALYTATLAMIGFFGATVWGGTASGWLARAGNVIGWAMFVAGFMDVLENIGMTAELGGNVAIAPFVFTVSSIKWLIVLAAVLYAVPTLVMIGVRLPALLR